MSVWSFLSGALGPLFQLADDMHTSDEERMTIKQAMYEVQAQFMEKVLEYEKQLLTARADIVKAEAQGGSWLQRSWRPITMLTFLALVVCDSFGWLSTPLAPEAWGLLKLGLGGYVVGRSAEKVMPKVMDALGKKGGGGDA